MEKFFMWLESYMPLYVVFTELGEMFIMLLKILGKNSFYLLYNSSSYECTVVSLFYLKILFNSVLSPNLEVHRGCHGISVMDIVNRS